MGESLYTTRSFIAASLARDFLARLRLELRRSMQPERTSLAPLVNFYGTGKDNSL